MFFVFRKPGSEKIFSSAARFSKSTWTSRCGDEPPSMLLYARTATTPENFSQMSLPAPTTYFSYSSSFPGRTSNRYSKVTISLPPFYLPVQQAALFPRNVEIPSWASTAMEFIDMISLAWA